MIFNFVKNWISYKEEIVMAMWFCFGFEICRLYFPLIFLFKLRKFYIVSFVFELQLMRKI